MSTVLAAVDAGAAAGDAVALAARLATASDAELLLFAVHPSPRVPLPAPLRPTVPPRAQLEQAVRELAVAAAAGDGGGAEPPPVEVVDDRAPARTIQQRAELAPAAFVVLGSSRRRGGRGEAAAGRVARQVLDAAPCPVAIAAHGLRERGASLGRLLVGVDDAPESQAALDVAVRLAVASGAELRLLAVAEDELAPAMTPIGEVVQLTDWEAAVAHRRAHAEHVLAAALERIAPQVPDARGEVRAGDPAEELAALATDADLLVVGSRRWGPLSRIAIGSTGDELMRGVPCSLLFVPRPADDGS